MASPHVLGNQVEPFGESLWLKAIGLGGWLWVLVLGIIPFHINSSVWWKLSTTYTKSEHPFPLCYSKCVVTYYRPQRTNPEVRSRCPSHQLLTGVPWYIRVLQTEPKGSIHMKREIYFKIMADKFKLCRAEVQMLWFKSEGCQAGEFVLALGGQSVF